MKNSKESIGVVYDNDYLIHTQGHHPERKERLEHIKRAIEKPINDDLVNELQPVPADVDDIALVHDREYIKSINDACLSGKRFLDMDTYIVPDSYRIALLSAGGAITGLRKIMSQTLRKVFVLNRPPGHHAEKARAQGFCLFNNIAIAAEVARRDYGFNRIAIVDWDVHHGNGTQHSFESDPGVLFISIHQSPAYPGTGQLSETGFGRGEGFTINIPLPAGCGDVEYDLFYQNIIIPVLDQYKPELLLISAGQDAYRQDPLAGMSLTFEGYYRMAEQLKNTAERWTGGKILLCLEGGYHLEGQAGAVIQVMNALGRWELSHVETSPELKPSMAAEQRFDEVTAIQRKYWEL